LLAAVRAILPSGHRDPNLVDEIAAHVWYALIENDGSLLDRFDPARGVRLITFLALIAKDHISRHFRSEFRRRSRESLVGGDGADSFDPDQNLDLSEFLSMLTPGERQFAVDHLLGESNSTDPPNSRSPASIWQFTRRIRKKLTGYLGPR
jgi:hypothetical protein